MDIGKLLGINIDPKKFNEYLAAVLTRVDKVATAWDRSANAQERIAAAQEKMADLKVTEIDLLKKIKDRTK